MHCIDILVTKMYINLQINIMLHKTHPRVSGPALLVVVADDVLVVGIGMLGEVALNQVASLFGGESEENVDPVDIAAEQTNWMTDFGWSVLEGQEVVGHLRWTCHFTRSLQAQNQEIQHQSVVLRDERRKLQSANDSVAVRVVHVLVVDDNVILGCHVVSNVVVHDETEQSIQKRQVNLFVEFLELRLEQDVALALGYVPNVLEVVHSCGRDRK